MATLIRLKTIAEVIQMRDEYRRNWPEHCMGFYTLDNFARWLQRDAQLRHVQIYRFQTERGRGESTLFLIVDRYQLFVNALTESDESELPAALSLLPDWVRGYKITSLPPRLFAAISTTLDRLGIKQNVAKLHMFCLKQDDAYKLPLSLPAEYEFRSLSLADAETVNSNWSSKQPGSLDFIRRLIEFNVSIAITTTDARKELVAWCTRCQCGFLGTLFVKESHRGKGLAKSAVTAFAHKVAEMGDDVLSLVHESNAISQKLFLHLGFQLAGHAHHIWAHNVPREALWPSEH